ncbi:MAG: type 4a pilus biogenesis protein PilO [Candidatus Pacebacteria bacterium]|jgi:Tfp pilus assembly protein PilO|nr:type 4a pilus biogenesis protein PilO [Candidatus Paceibacterota bacterium]
MKGILPVLAVVIAGVLFYLYIDPTYEQVKLLRAEEATLNTALTRALELQQTRDQLLSRYNTFSPEDLSRLEKMLPDHVDNVRLALDMDSMASAYGMRVKNLSIQKPEEDNKKKPRQVQTVGPDERLYESMVLSFSVTGEYDTFQQFIRDLEKSLRLVDIESVSFSSTDVDLYEFTVSLRTYWLKP